MCERQPGGGNSDPHPSGNRKERHGSSIRGQACLKQRENDKGNKGESPFLRRRIADGRRGVMPTTLRQIGMVAGGVRKTGVGKQKKALEREGFNLPQHEEMPLTFNFILTKIFGKNIRIRGRKSGFQGSGIEGTEVGRLAIAQKVLVNGVERRKVGLGKNARTYPHPVRRSKKDWGLTLKWEK